MIVVPVFQPVLKLPLKYFIDFFEILILFFIKVWLGCCYVNEFFVFSTITLILV